ncbi:hypothetical protein ACOZGD_21825 [Streptomyces murinus]
MGLLVAALVCAVLTAALGGCPRMRALAGSAVDAPHRPFATAAPRAVARPRIEAKPRIEAGPWIADVPQVVDVPLIVDVPQVEAVSRIEAASGSVAVPRTVAAETLTATGPRCQGGGATTAVTPTVAPAPRVHACVVNGAYQGARASAPAPAPEPPSLLLMPDGRPEPLLRV